MQALKRNRPIAVTQKKNQQNCKIGTHHPPGTLCEASKWDDQSSIPLRRQAWRWGSRQNLIPHHYFPPGEVGAGGGYASRPSDPAPLLFLIRPRVYICCVACSGFLSANPLKTSLPEDI